MSNVAVANDREFMGFVYENCGAGDGGGVDDIAIDGDFIDGWVLVWVVIFVVNAVDV